MSFNASEFLERYRATRPFVNRDEACDTFWDEFKRVCNEPRTLRVLAFSGLGGAGKTRLLRQLSHVLQRRTQADGIKNIRSAFVSLDAHEFSSFTDVLVACRSQMKLPFFLFDYALTSYWLRSGIAPKELKRKGLSSDSLVWDFVDMLGEAVDNIVPARLVLQCMQRIREAILKRDASNRAIVEMIDQTNPEAIPEQLPYYLGLGIRAAQAKGLHCVLFLDSIESIESFRTFPDESDRQQWLRTLIVASSGGLFVLAGREVLRWSGLDPSWDDVIVQQAVGPLTKDASDVLLRRVGVAEEDVRAAIIDVSMGMPFYLDLCVNIYLRFRNAERLPSAHDFLLPRQEVVHRFLTHLPSHERDLILTLSFLSWFDGGLLAVVAEDIRMPLAEFDFDDFVSRGPIALVSDVEGGWRIHDLIRGYAVSSAGRTYRARAARTAAAYFARRWANYSVGKLVAVFSEILALLSDLQESSEPFEDLLQLGVELIDQGHWLELKELWRERADATIVECRIDAMLLLLAGLVVRRTAGPAKARAYFETLRQHSNLLGRHESLFWFHAANIARLLGFYKMASTEYERLVRAPLGHSEKDLRAKVTRQYADCLSVRGRFRSADAALAELLSWPGLATLDKAETLRIHGHVLRLNGLWSQALDVYDEADSFADSCKAVGLIAKLATNRIEALAWVDPRRAIELAGSAISLNSKLGSDIELGKIEAALAIACARLRELNEESVEYYQKALERQKRTGYRAGELFALVAGTIAQHYIGNSAEAAALQSELTRCVTELEAYSFLQLPYFILQRNERAVQRTRRSHEWLKFSSTAKALRDALRVSTRRGSRPTRGIEQ